MWRDKEGEGGMDWRRGCGLYGYGDIGQWDMKSCLRRRTM